MVLGDRKLSQLLNGVPSNFSAEVHSYANLYPFGMPMPGRFWDSSLTDPAYRFGYTGMEGDDEVAGDGNHYTTVFREFDPKLGRWWSDDPITHPGESPYAGMGNNPTSYTDALGLEGGGSESSPLEQGSKWTALPSPTGGTVSIPPGAEVLSVVQASGDIPLTDGRTIHGAQPGAPHTVLYQKEIYRPAYDAAGEWIGYVSPSNGISKLPTTPPSSYRALERAMLRSFNGLAPPTGNFGFAMFPYVGSSVESGSASWFEEYAYNSVDPFWVLGTGALSGLGLMDNGVHLSGRVASGVQDYSAATMNAGLLFVPVKLPVGRVLSEGAASLIGAVGTRLVLRSTMREAAVTGAELQAHHIFMQSCAKFLKISERDLMCVLLSPEQHAILTNQLGYAFGWPRAGWLGPQVSAQDLVQTHIGVHRNVNMPELIEFLPRP